MGYHESLKTWPTISIQQTPHLRRDHTKRSDSTKLFGRVELSPVESDRMVITPCHHSQDRSTLATRRRLHVPDALYKSPST